MAKLGEFELIDRLLKPRAALGQPFYRNPLALGIGDDAALLPPLPQGEQLAVSTDMLVEGRHYLAHADPFRLGHKALAVNLSDLAAMGAQPVAFTLSMALREVDSAWIDPFLDGMLGLAREAGCPLVGGDTTGLPSDGAQCISVTVLGSVPVGQALRRDGMRPGDQIWVSGTLGDPAYALREGLVDMRLEMPQPRLALGLALRGLAHAAIDVSDGLAAEVGHLVQCSSDRDPASTHVQAVLDWHVLPLGDRLRQAIAAGAVTDAEARQMAACGGDDYELVFSAPPSATAALQKLAGHAGVMLSCIGHVRHAVDDDRPLVWRDHADHDMDASLTGALGHGGFRHF
jgi:thiamine-monophosphate kinase